MKRVLIAIAIVVVVIGAGYALLPLFSVGRVAITPETQHKWHLDGKFVGCYDGTHHKAYELITNPKGSTGTRSAFLLAKTDNGESEFITVQGSAWYAVGIEKILILLGGEIGILVNIFTPTPNNCGYYRVKYKATDNADWETILDKSGPKVSWLNARYSDNTYGDHKFFHQDIGIFQDAMLLPSLTFSIIGNHPGAIKVEMMGYTRGHILDSWHKKILASDEAELLPSGGVIRRVGERATYEVGETMKMHVQTEYSGSTVGEQNKGYQIKIRNPDGEVEWIKDLQDDWEGDVEVLIEEDWYNPNWSNQFKFELVNQMRDLGVVSFFAIDLIGLAPANPVISSKYDDDPRVEAGTDIELIITAPEKEGAAAIEKFKYCAYLGSAPNAAEPVAGSANWIQIWIDVAAEKVGDVYSAQVTITAPDYPGDIVMKAISIGEGNRASENMMAYGLLLWKGDKPELSQINPENYGLMVDKGGKTVHFFDWILPKPIVVTEDFTNLIVAIALFAICLIIALIPQIPIPYGALGRLALILTGMLLAIAAYFLI